MDPRVIYEAWAPPDGVWSPWAKPVLFAHLSPREPPGTVPVPSTAPELGLDLAKAGGMALVLDLPGLESLGLGLQLCGHGYRPIPLFNACLASNFLGDRGDEVVPVAPLLSALVQGVDWIKAAGLAAEAPPAFLQEAKRQGAGKPIGPGSFDNRWVVFPTDFPSASFLFRQGIDRVQVIHRGPLARDLLDVLATWQRGRIELLHCDLETSPTRGPLVLRHLWRSRLRLLARRGWAHLSLWRNPRGGFGGFVPEAGSSVG